MSSTDNPPPKVHLHVANWFTILLGLGLGWSIYASYSAFSLWADKTKIEDTEARLHDIQKRIIYVLGVLVTENNAIVEFCKIDFQSRKGTVDRLLNAIVPDLTKEERESVKLDPIRETTVVVEQKKENNK